MTKVAIGFSTKDKPEQVKRIVENLLQPELYDLFWFDGSDTDAGRHLPMEYAGKFAGAYALEGNVRGGPDRAFVHAVTTMLRHPNNYTHIGYCEDDVLLPKDWFLHTFDLFNRLPHVGVVSARAYEDRVLLQSDGYAVMHNLGWGHLILTREAAELTLQHYRTGWTTENRKVFAQMSGRDIATQWGWRGASQWFCADWGNDAVLAQNGLLSLALTPTPVDMIGQNPPLEQQGLRLLTKRTADLWRDDRHLKFLVENCKRIRDGVMSVDARPRFFRLDEGGQIFFAHQLGALVGAVWKGTWELEWDLGFGPFNFRAASPDCELLVPVAGMCEILLGGGQRETDGKALVIDTLSGFEVEPRLKGKPGSNEKQQMFLNVHVPASVAYRTIRVKDLAPGCVVYGIKVRDPQPIDRMWRFSDAVIPANSG